MTRPKRPTLAELRKEARRVFGPGSRIHEHEHQFHCTVYSGTCDSFLRVSRDPDDDRGVLLTMLRALPDWRKP